LILLNNFVVSLNIFIFAPKIFDKMKREFNRTGPKKPPYGQCNFEKIRTENYVYVDKTRFIEQLENEANSYHFLIRPRKFGKSLFLSMLRHYYDICCAENFETLFGDLYIGKNPTPKRNSLFVIKFSFSGLDTSSVEDFKSSFTSAIRMSVQYFLTEHRNLLENYETLKKEAWNITNVREHIEFAFNIINSFNRKAYIIIDEYDHFANDLIALGTNLSVEQYKDLIWANGVVRDFYETLKDNTENAIDTIFITGITPIMLDDVTSGFNISNNLSNDLRYNEMLGFTEEEVEFLIDECGVDRTKINIDRKFLYNGYKFHEEAENKLYNSAMLLYFLHQVVITTGKLKRLIDLNLKTDYGRIEMLLKKTQNIEKLEHIIEHSNIPSEVIDRFSINKIHESQNFLSLLYYMGLVTIDSGDNSKPLLSIPNYSVKTMYWEYMEYIIRDRNPEMIYDPSIIIDGLASLAFDGDYKPFFAGFFKNFVSLISNRDLINFSEKNIKFLLLSILFQNNFYLPISEPENSGGYVDTYLQRRNYLYPNITTDWVWEIKYVKQAEAKNQSAIETKKNDAIAKLKRYKSSNLFKDRTDIRYLIVLFIGKTEYWIEEVSE